MQAKLVIITILFYLTIITGEIIHHSTTSGLMSDSATICATLDNHIWVKYSAFSDYESGFSTYDGTNWNYVEPYASPTGAYLNDVYPKDSNKLWVAYNSGKILTYFDGSDWAIYNNDDNNDKLLNFQFGSEGSINDA